MPDRDIYSTFSEEGAVSDRTSLNTSPISSPSGSSAGSDGDIFSTFTEEAPSENDRETFGLQPGDLLDGEFALVEILGRGAMGEVWLANELLKSGEFVRKVVVKIVPKNIRNVDMEIERVRATFLAVQALSHAHICPVYNLGNDNRCGYFLVMKYLLGKNLAEFASDHIKRNGKQLTLNEVLPLLKQIASALDYAHGKGVIHRDIKPANILRSENDGGQLIDFGLAEAVQSENEPVAVEGTIVYMSPEQLRGERQDGRSDQFSFAATVYELLTGQPPFVASDRDVLLHRILVGKILPVPDVPAGVNAALQKALSKEAKERFANCTDFVTKLEEAVNAKPTVAKPAVVKTLTVGKTQTAQVPAQKTVPVARPTFKDYDKRDAFLLFQAAATCSVQDVRYYIEKGIDVNAQEVDGNTLLHKVAMCNPSVEVVKYLVSQGADVNAKGRWNETPLSEATKHNSNAEIWKYLVSQGADVRVETEHGDTPLRMIARKGSVQDVRYLIEHGADVLAKDKYGRTSLHEAARYNPSTEVIQYLVSQGADVHAKDPYGRTPLHEVVRYKSSAEAIQYLVSQGADVNAKLRNGDTVLHEAARCNPSVEVVKYLVSQGADIHAKNDKGFTPSECTFSTEKKRFLRPAMKAKTHAGHTGWIRAVGIGALIGSALFGIIRACKLESGNAAATGTVAACVGFVLFFAVWAAKRNSTGNQALGCVTACGVSFCGWLATWMLAALLFQASFLGACAIGAIFGACIGYGFFVKKSAA